MNKDSSNTFWKIVLAVVIVFMFLMVYYGNAQTITKKYDGVHRIRIDGAATGNLKPCDVYFPGGGFVLQNWAVDNALSLMSVSSGHVSCRVGYSTSFFPSLPAAEKGIQDCMNAVAWVKKNWQTYGIDTNKIYLWGTSAGGFCALGVYEYKVKVAGIVNMWGGVLQLSYLTRNNIPVFNVSTEFDPTVDIGCGESFGVQCCGSQAITDELIRLGIKVDYLQFEGQKHGVKDIQSITKIFNQAQTFFK